MIDHRGLLITQRLQAFLCFCVVNSATLQPF